MKYQPDFLWLSKYRERLRFLLLPGGTYEKPIDFSSSKARSWLSFGASAMTEPLTSELRKALAGWFLPFKYNLERWAYALQRISGIVVTAYFLAHIVETGNVVGGVGVWSVSSADIAGDVWTATFRFLDNPLFDAGLVIIGFMLAYHTMNGIRLTLAEFGFILGRPARPDFPYTPKSFSKAQRGLFWLSIAFAVLTAVYSINVLFGVIP